MYSGFPRDLLTLLLCPVDRGCLTVEGEGSRVRHGALTCKTCKRTFVIRDGIVDFFESRLLDDESRNEHSRRDETAPRADAAWEKSPINEMEIGPTMEASAPLQDARVLEVGAGMGRHTVRMLHLGAHVVALDFSRESLMKLAGRVSDDAPIGLVQADCTRFWTRRGSFDLVASTLMSNLPTPKHREGVMRLGVWALKPTGRFVFGVHHHGFWNWIRRERKSGHYPEAAIYRYCFTPDEIVRETKSHFIDVKVIPMQITFPLTARLGLPVVWMSRVASHVRLFKIFAQLLLIVASQPVELP